MRRAEIRESLFDRVARPRASGPADDRAADRLERSLHRVEPDPLFRRRLRSSVVNYYVASREGHLRRARRPRRQMGTLGRSVLYASVALASGVSAVGAASQGSLPGDPLYGVKLRLEEIRMQIAPPSVRDTLAEMALSERTRELERLVAAGAWDQVTSAAHRLASAEATLRAIDPGAADAPATGNALAVLERALDAAPAAARPGLQQAMASASNEHPNANGPASATDEPKAKPSQASEPSQPAKPSQASEPSPPGQDPSRPRGPH